jgi:hypothetical protein
MNWASISGNKGDAELRFWVGACAPELWIKWSYENDDL